MSLFGIYVTYQSPIGYIGICLMVISWKALYVCLKWMPYIAICVHLYLRRSWMSEYRWKLNLILKSSSALVQILETSVGAVCFSGGGRWMCLVTCPSICCHFVDWSGVWLGWKFLLHGNYHGLATLCTDSLTPIRHNRKTVMWVTMIILWQWHLSGVRSIRQQINSQFFKFLCWIQENGRA